MVKDRVHPSSRASSRQRGESMYDVCEVFSPARVVKEAGKIGLKGGWSLDLLEKCSVTGRTWNCLEEKDREWARRMLRNDKPQLLVVCPPCTLFSQLQNLCPNGLPPERCPSAWRDALVMLEFAVELCEMQQKAGRSFVFEHPRTATSWEIGGLKRLIGTEGVFTGLLDMCCLV